MLKDSLLLFLIIIFISQTGVNAKGVDSTSVSPSDIPTKLVPYKHSMDDGTAWVTTSQVKFHRLLVVLGGFAIFDAIGFKKIADLQYTTETSNFHFHDPGRDIREYKQMDKIGHVVEAYYMSHLTSKIYRWSGFSAPTSIWLGSLTGFIWMLQIEITDGFYKAWGFSLYDLSANILGCGYSALQQFYPQYLKGIRFKVSYSPSKAYKKDLYSTVSKSFLDDYEGFTWWLTINIYDVLPRSWKDDYPGWLRPWGLGIGHGVKDIATDVFNGEREIFIGLDFDLTKIPTGQSNFLKFWKDEFNAIRLPLPAVRLYPRTVWFGFYFSQDF